MEQNNLKEKIEMLLKARCQYWVSVNSLFQILNYEYSKVAIYNALHQLLFDGHIYKNVERTGVKKIPTFHYKYKSKKDRK